MSASGESGTGTFLVERYWPGVTEASLSAAVSRLTEAVRAMAGRGRIVRHLLTTLVPEEESVLCLFEASTAEDVAEANRLAAFPVHRIVPAVRVAGAAG